MKPGPGRPSLGDRDKFSVRPARPVGRAIRENAEALGMDFGAYVSMVVAQALDMPEYAPKPLNPHDQQELPLKTA
ncbi:MAG: hypothetical protein ACR2P2_17730 [Nakamurella sp.]